jgi:hypothetical protein
MGGIIPESVGKRAAAFHWAAATSRSGSQDALRPADVQECGGMMYIDDFAVVCLYHISLTYSRQYTITNNVPQKVFFGKSFGKC